MERSLEEASKRIKAEALRLGFVACGIAKAQAVEEDVAQRVEAWVSEGYHGEMSYLERNADLRRDPRLLLPSAHSLIMVAMNYYAKVRQDNSLPQFATYAYGRDYHKVVKKRLDKLLAFIRAEIDPCAEGRSFADSAPILERYWAERAGLGWRGKNGLIIIPQVGSFHVLGALLISTELIVDTPLPNRCGSCTRCLDSCPTNALISPGVMDARRCISYLTIEQEGEIPSELAEKLGKRIYGCDTCQEVCPWNRSARPTDIEDFALRPILEKLSYVRLEAMQEEEFDKAFAGSPIRRAGLRGLKRSLRAIRSQSNQKQSDQRLND